MSQRKTYIIINSEKGFFILQSFLLEQGYHWRGNRKCFHSLPHYQVTYICIQDKELSYGLSILDCDTRYTYKSIEEYIKLHTPKKIHRPHAELIKQWAEDDSIEIEQHCNNKWTTCYTPMWMSGSEYRIKPLKPLEAEEAEPDIDTTVSVKKVGEIMSIEITGNVTLKPNGDIVIAAPKS